MSTPPRASGFTLIELMIVVAIIGILAALAVPNFMRFQLRAKAGEGKLVLNAVRTAEASYFGEFGTYVQMAVHPSGAAGTARQTWTVCPAVVTMSSAGYCIMGYFPEGPTYYTYAVNTTNANTSVATTPNVEFFADALSDIDADGTPNLWGLQMPDQSGAVTLAGTQGCTGVIDGVASTPMTNAVGPCALGMGWTIF